LRDAGLKLEVIGYFSLATLASSFKFLWAPWIDRARIPLLTRWLGHRRSWMLVCQGLIMFGLWLVAGSNPVANLGGMALFAIFVGFASADSRTSSSMPGALKRPSNRGKERWPLRISGDIASR
jgi:PAT family beta-lactamase induction signal transducer AmpG